MQPAGQRAGNGIRVFPEKEDRMIPGKILEREVWSHSGTGHRICGDRVGPVIQKEPHRTFSVGDFIGMAAPAAISVG